VNSLHLNDRKFASMVRMYSREEGRELVVTTQVPLVFSLGNKSVNAPVFVQPDSKQACLLGINAVLA